MSPPSYASFPFSLCDIDNLKDSSKSLTTGLTSALFGYRYFTDEQEDDSEFDYEDDYQDDFEEEDDYYDDDELTDLEEDLSDIEKTDPQEAVTPRSSPSTFKFAQTLKPSLKPLEDINTMSLSLTRNKISSIISEYFPSVIHDEDFREIKNYVTNSILESFETSDISTICNKIIRKSYRQTLVSQIRELFIDKFEEMKIDAFFDHTTSFLTHFEDFKDYGLLTNPNMYEKYMKIWKLDKPNYKYYGKDYFIEDYFGIFKYYPAKESTQSKVDLHLRAGFLMNFDKFYTYYGRDLKSGKLQYDDDDSSDESDYEEEYSTKDNEDLESFNLYSTGSSNYTYRSSTSSESSTSDSRRSSTKSADEKYKSLRFNDQVDIVSIDIYEPVNYVHSYLTA
ncbi:uncharacterized protein RJT20DRAFT_17586 [Scheffersomyces xylosifermentans]|uniref:uncharacterized protein n=1 Tax=Scheffersomyces xylosifermentans TaxID=1304137 RepID=UPI00315D6E4C